MNHEPETHANVTVNRWEDGLIKDITVKAEYVEKDPENGEHGFGASAVFEYSVVEGTAEFHAVREINDAGNGPEVTNLLFIRTIPIAEDAVGNVPGIEEITSAEERIRRGFELGRNAL